MSNSIGDKFRFTSFGESHGYAVGGVIDGCPSNMVIDEDSIYRALERRSGRESVCPNAISMRSKREADTIKWLSGIYEGKTLGTPITFIVENSDAKSDDYSYIEHLYRPSHADYTYQMKYGIRDFRGGGRASARETVSRVVAGDIAKQILKNKGISIVAEIVQIGDVKNADEYADYLSAIAQDGDSIGGVVKCVVSGLPIGVGEPIFDKLQARLAYAVMSINGCKGFDYGSGFDGVGMKGSELNDEMPFSTNHAGGILGGISTGQDVVFRCVFKPTASIKKEQQTITDTGEIVNFSVKGRHDACYVLRVPVIVESMAALVIADYLL